MKANELRIGNLVCDGSDIFEISSITRGGQLRLFSAKENHSSGVSKIKAIPLTEEWLLKMGFENNHSSVNFKTFYNNGFDYRIELYSDGKVFFDELREIQYVHQLQNLYFALTGEELTIK